MAVRGELVEKLGGVSVFIGREGSADHTPEAFERAEAIHDRGGFIATANHAVGALGIAGGDAVLFELRRLHLLLKRISVAVLQEIAGLLPAKDVVSGRAPGGAFVLAIAHEEFKE